MPETNATGSLISDHLGALTAAALVGAVIATVVVITLGPMQPLGDEPPIRVRNGSVDLQLQAGGKWESNGGDKKNWKIKGEPDRDSNQYDVVVYGANSSTCANGSTTGNPVIFTVMEGTSVVGTIEVRAAGNKTRVKSDKDLGQSVDELISHSGNERFISDVTVGSNSVCKLTAKNAGLRVLLLEP